MLQRTSQQVCAAPALAPRTGFASHDCCEFYPYPEEQLSAIALLNHLGNQQPRGDLAIEDMQMKPEQLRQNERLLYGERRPALDLLHHRESHYKLRRLPRGGMESKLSGISIPMDDWGLPTAQQKGLGPWLKAAMLDKVLKDRPLVKVVRTGNADSNAPMLEMNHELGFTPYMASALWQVDVGRMMAYLTTSIQA